MSDDRTKREKLEAMANQTASPREAEVAKRKLAEHDKTHPLFRRRDPNGWRNPLNIKNDAPAWDTWTPNPKAADPKPHVYTASRGDALGCDTCARSKDNKHANHISLVNGREVQGKQCTTRNAMGHRCEGYPNHRGNHIYVNRG